MKEDFVGREREIKRLQRCMEAKQAQLIVVYGRKRAGKTYLIESFFDGDFDFRFVGVCNQNREAQLTNFADEIMLQTGKKTASLKNWHEAFLALRTYLSSLDNSRKRIVLFDELPWMETCKSDFLASLEWVWNGWGSKQDHLVMVVSGSAASWIKKTISDNKGGLFNRRTCRLYLEPFDLRETEQFLKIKGITY